MTGPSILSSGLRSMSLAPGSRRHTYEFLERAVECGFGFVANLGAGMRKACALFDQPRSKLKPPARHVLHRRNFNELGEPSGKGGAREADLLCQPVEGPRLGRPSMDQA